MSRSRIQDELEALKKRGIAQSQKDLLKDAKKFRTPEEERTLIKKLFLQKYKRNFTNIPKPSATSSTSEWDSWHSQQRKLALVEKKKKQEAEKLLRMYRGSVSTRNNKETETEVDKSKLRKGVSYNSMLRPTNGSPSKNEQNGDKLSSREGDDAESIDDESTIYEEADEEMKAFIASMKDMKQEEVEAMLASAEEDASVDSSSTLPVDTEAERLAEAAKKDEEDRLVAEAAKKVEEERIAAEAAKKAEEERLAAEAAKRAEEKRIAAKKAEEDRLAAEAAKKVEDERLAAEAAKKAEEERLAAEARKAEEERIAAENKEPESFQEFSFRDVISKDENSQFPAEKGRYELYVSPACPHSHEILVVLALKGLTDVVSTVTAEPILQSLSSDDETDFFGWVFPTINNDDIPTEDTSFRNILELYQAADDTSEGKYTLPVLWDTTHRTIVNNNFYDILRMLNNEFNDYATYPEVNLYPKNLLIEIASFNTWMYDSFTNIVNECAVATTQESYINAVMKYAEAFDKIESILSESSYLIENTFTVVDVCLFCSLFRLDEVYNARFYLNTRSVMSSESMKTFCKQIYAMENVKDTCDIDTIKKYYFGNAIVPERKVIPIGPNFLDCLL